MGKARTVRIVATDGQNTKVLFWVNVDEKNVYCGIRDVPVKGSYHESGEVHMKEHAASKADAPAAIFQCYHNRSNPMMFQPRIQLGSSVHLGSATVPNRKECLDDFPPLKKPSKYDGIVYMDTRLLDEWIHIQAWVAKPKNFFEPIPNPPGFRSVFEMDDCWVVIHCGNWDE